MRLILTLVSKDDRGIILPRANLNILQGFIYSLFSNQLASFLHDEGFRHGKRRLKLFSFSWLQGQGPVRGRGDWLSLAPPVTLHITSPLLHVVEEAAYGALAGEELRLGRNELECTGARIVRDHAESESILVHALSPVTCYSTVTRADGSPYVVYYKPQETAFQEQIDGNLRRKWELLSPGEPAPPQSVRITPVGRPREQVARFSTSDRIPIKGWWGLFRLRGPRCLLQAALDAGLGAKNSAGWGCVELVGDAKRVQTR